MNAKKLKYETDTIKRKIGISKDLTREKREVEFILVKELKEKRGKGETGCFSLLMGSCSERREKSEWDEGRLRG